jgi:hypothetical protein
MSTKTPTPITVEPEPEQEQEKSGAKPNTIPLDTELSTGPEPQQQDQPLQVGNEQPGPEQPGPEQQDQPLQFGNEQQGNEQPGPEQPGPQQQGQPFQFGNEQQGQPFQFGNEQQGNEQFGNEQFGNEQQGTEPMLDAYGNVVDMNLNSPNPVSIPEVNTSVTDTKNIMIKLDKSTLVSLSQNLNTNLLVTISAYKIVLTKLTEIVTNPDKQQKINENVEMLNGIEKSVTELLNSVQENLDIPTDKLINASTILEKGNNSFINTALQIDAATILAFLGSAVAMAGGKKTRGRYKHVHKKTKRNKKV